MKRGLASSFVHSAFATTRRWRLQLVARVALKAVLKAINSRPTAGLCPKHTRRIDGHRCVLSAEHARILRR